MTEVKIEANNHDSRTRKYNIKKSIVFYKTKEKYGELSNMAGGFPLYINNINILTAEALYQACKYPHIPEAQALIIQQNSPMTAKMKSKLYNDFVRADWHLIRHRVMRWCLRVKLAQNYSTFGEVLLSTGNLPIVEKSLKDDYWGAKPAAENSYLVGRNILGRLLMELREKLRTEDEEHLKKVKPLGIENFILFESPIGITEPYNPNKNRIQNDLW